MCVAALQGLRCFCYGVGADVEPLLKANTGTLGVEPKRRVYHSGDTE